MAHKFQALEEAAKELIEGGMSFPQVCAEFLDVPRHKIREWYRKYSNENFSDKPVLVALESIQSETEWIKASAKQIFAEEFDSTIKLRALETYIKVLALEQRSETESKKEAPDTQALREMSDDELNQAFKDLL